MATKWRHVKEVLFIRKNHVITDTSGNVVFEGKYQVKAGTFSSINAAKRRVRELQDEHGQGSVRVAV
jgi:hypothetical protein